MDLNLGIERNALDLREGGASYAVIALRLGLRRVHDAELAVRRGKAARKHQDARTR